MPSGAPIAYKGRVKLLLLTLSVLTLVPVAICGERDAKVNAEREALEGGDLWIYNDLARGFEVARESGKPLLVVYRCIP